MQVLSDGRVRRTEAEWRAIVERFIPARAGNSAHHSALQTAPWNPSGQRELLRRVEPRCWPQRTGKKRR